MKKEKDLSGNIEYIDFASNKKLLVDTYRVNKSYKD